MIRRFVNWKLTKLFIPAFFKALFLCKTIVAYLPIFREISEEFIFYLLAFLHEKMTFEAIPVGHSFSISSQNDLGGTFFSL